MKELQVDQKMKTFSCVEFFRKLHLCVKQSLKQLSVVAIKGPTCTTEDGRH